MYFQPSIYISSSFFVSLFMNRLSSLLFQRCPEKTDWHTHRWLLNNIIALFFFLLTDAQLLSMSAFSSFSSFSMNRFFLQHTHFFFSVASRKDQYRPRWFLHSPFCFKRRGSVDIHASVLTLTVPFYCIDFPHFVGQVPLKNTGINNTCHELSFFFSL